MSEPRKKPAQPAQESPSTQTEKDPWAAVMALGRRHVVTGMLLGLALGLIVHGAAAARGHELNQLSRMRMFATSVQADVYSRLQATIDIETDEPEPEEPEPEEIPEPEPVQEQEPEPVKPPPEPIRPTDTPPPPAAAPAAAQAGKVLAAEPDTNEPLDLTGNTFVTGNGTYAGGITASTGKSKKAVYDRKAQPTGIVGGTGKAKTQVVKGPDLSRPARKPGNFRCAFTAEAQAQDIQFMKVRVLVQIGKDGKATNATLAGRDPGFGLGNRARQCALRNRYGAALGRDGKPIASTLLLTVRFQQR